jgi:superfamily II DNA/RNA helicase
MSGIRHEVALAKVPHVVEHVRESLENGPVVLFVHHKDVVAQIAAEFPGCVTLTGETSMENRQKAVDDFQAGRASLFIGNIQAAGVGITLTRSAHVIFAELDWVPGNLSQAEDRCHRIGQTESVLVQHIVLEDSMDADMAKKLIVKQEVITTALDNKEETNYGTISGSSVEVIEQNPVVVEIRKDKIDEQAEKITDEQATLILQGLRRIAGVCDGAREQDGCGFNRYDTNIGKSLASQTVLSKRQCVLGRKLCIKYQRQLGMELVAIIKGIQS